MAAKFEIDVYANDGAHTGMTFVSTDKLGRLRLSSGLVSKLSTRGMPIKLYVGYDKANHRIALGKVDIVKPTDANPVSFDAKRHYGVTRGFFHKHGLPFEPRRYFYDGDYQGWMMFKPADWTAEDGRRRPRKMRRVTEL